MKNILLEGRHLCRMLLVLAALLGLHASTLAAETAKTYPRFKVDPTWPKQLPNNYILGNIGGITVDSHDHIWVLSRPRTLDKTDMLGRPPTNRCCVAAPAVTEFDASGNYIQGWGGPDKAGTYQWPQSEHGITVDHNGNVWICGNERDDDQCLKFTHAGKLLLQIGHAGASKGSLDTLNLRQPAQVAVWPATNEVFIADGYGNRRVIVFDADSGKFKRMWGAYGKRPDAGAPRGPASYDPAARQFNLVAHRDFQGRAGLCERPAEQPYSGFHSRRQVHQRGIRRARNGQSGLRNNVQLGVFGR